ncbi:26S proteasome regulatory subunit rpn-8 [Reticulomyxa filosa]|uniref:26S proteasome regulatory subunit rpn-8 n=1 Tax=Reticulomyxa filosa TaxID=46433 RepID=X6N9A6_RETFI|nr:26S proteasome regulatory subunit rpn-8 [Reticulomyxa filosa]|eukprot:ETO22641.1 26S proteasome regulatory subunit rpn-8 [Reticulomyxa filosa]
MQTNFETIANEKVVGWYSTGPKLKKNDIEIHKLFYRYNVEPTLAVIQVRELTEDLPTKSYVAVDVVQSDGRHEKEFAHVMSAVVASEAEEVGVEHLLREIQDISLSTLTTEVNRKMTGLHGLVDRLSTIRDYLEKVATERLPINQDILTNLQLIFNLLPNLSKIQLIQVRFVFFCFFPRLAKAKKKKKPFYFFHLLLLVLSLLFYVIDFVCYNDMMLNVYVASLLRSILALDQLLENRLQNKLRVEYFYFFLTWSEQEDKKEKDEQNGKKKEKEKEKEKDKDKDNKDKDNKDKEKDENKNENKKTEKDDKNK